MPRRKSGGQRATETRKARDEALLAEHAPWNAADLRAFARLPRREDTAAGAYQEALDALRLAIRRIARNPVLTPRERHEMLGRHAASLAKAADAARIVQQLGADLRDAHRVIESLEAKLRAARPAARDPSGDSAARLQ